MNAREETPKLAMICDIALDIVRTLRSPRRYNEWVAITDLSLRHYMHRRRPIYAKELHQALIMMNCNIVQTEYEIDSSTPYLRAPMAEYNMLNGQYQRCPKHCQAKE